MIVLSDYQKAKVLWDALKDNDIGIRANGVPQFVEDHYPEWRDEWEEMEIEAAEMRRHQLSFTQPF